MSQRSNRITLIFNDLEFLGVDYDGNSFDLADEILTGHTDFNANDIPMQEEVDEACEALDEAQNE